jgi:nicotinate-nucleotide adenylyltransferase
MDIGLFFGSFNPIHIGHLIIVNHILNLGKVERTWLIVSPLNPFKHENSLLDENDRFELVKASVLGDERIIASDVEFHLPRPSFSYHTLHHLRNNFPQHNFSIIMGSDSFQSLQKWKNFEEITANHKIFIYRRPGFEADSKIDAEIEIINAPLLDISATEIRDLIKTGRSIRYLVPDKVREQIERDMFYKK